MVVTFTKFLNFCKSDKIIAYSHLNCTNFKKNFKDNFVREKGNKMTSKPKTVNIFALDPN